MAKIRKIYDQTIKPDGSKTTIYPITSTRAVYTPDGETLDSYLKDGYFHGADLRGYKTVSNVTDLPTTENQFGWLIGEDLYVWVGTGGDTLGGLYQNCGHFRTPYVPDDEDLVADSDNELKLKDRTVEDGGMGYVIVRKDKTFAEQVIYENTIYEIRYDFDLDDGSVTVPSGCVLKFNGGSIRNGTLSGYPVIDAPNVQVFYDMALDLDYVEAEWIGVLPYGNAMTNVENMQGYITNHLRTDPVLDHKRYTIHFNKRARYYLGDGISIPKGHIVFFKGVACTQDYQAHIVFPNVTGTCITVYGQFTAENLHFQGKSTGGYDDLCDYIIDYKRTDDASQENDSVCDTDGRLLECLFTYAQTCVRLSGRQTYIDGCGFSLAYRGVLIEDLIPTGITEGGPNFAFGRNNCIQRCRFHMNFSLGCIVCTGTDQRNMTIADNIADIIWGPFLIGNFNYGKITGNSVHAQHWNNTKGLPSPQYYSGMELGIISNTLIQGNKFDYNGDYKANVLNEYGQIISAWYLNTLTSFIVFNGAVSKTDIIDNKFGSCSQEGFVFKDNASDVNISRNTVNSVCTDTDLYHYSYISAPTGNKTYAYLAKFDPTKTISNVFITDNVVKQSVMPAAPISGIYSTNLVGAPGLLRPKRNISTVVYSDYIYKIGKITDTEAGGGFTLISGQVYNSDQSLSVVTISKSFTQYSETLKVTHTEILGDCKGEIYLDPATEELYYVPLYEYRNCISMADSGYGFTLFFPSPYSGDSIPESWVLCTQKISGGSTSRPANLGDTRIGFQYFDTSLGKPIYWTNDTSDDKSGWVDATGTAV